MLFSFFLNALNVINSSQLFVSITYMLYVVKVYISKPLYYLHMLICEILFENEPVLVRLEDLNPMCLIDIKSTSLFRHRKVGR